MALSFFFRIFHNAFNEKEESSMKTYEIIVKRDRKYGLEKSPYVMGRIIGILEGSGADVIEQTFRISEGFPMRVCITANDEQLNRVKTAITKSYPFMIDIVKC